MGRSSAILTKCLRLILGALTVSVLIPMAQAQPRILSADEAVQMALERPDRVSMIEAGIDLARSDVLAARTWPNPELHVERIASGSSGFGEDETSFVLSQRFDLGGRRGLARRAATLGLSAAEAGAVAERELIRQMVLKRYYAAVAAAHRFEAYRDWQDRLGELGEIAGRRHAAGDLSGYDSGRIRQSVELASFRLASVEAELMVSTEALAGLIGVDGLSIGVDPREVLLPGAGPASRDEPRQALGNAQLTALNEQRQATEAAARAAERLSLPVTVGLGQRRLSGPVGSDDALILELSVPLPLFDRNQAERARARAEADRAESRYRMTLHERQSRAQAHRQELAMLASAAKRLEAEVLPLARQLTAMANSSFAEGELELVELLAVMSAEIEAVDQLLDLQYRARLAWIELESLVESDPTVIGESP